MLRSMLGPEDIMPETFRGLRRRDYAQLVASGAFEDERVELLYGTVVRMSPHGPEHDAPLERLMELLVRALPEEARVRVQSSFAASDDSVPEPDLAVVPRRDYDDAHPTEAWLVVEIAKSSLRKDRSVKARLYAETGVEEYWIVNLVDGVIERYVEPAKGAYRRCSTHRPGEVIRLSRFPEIEIAVDDVLRRRPG
jgi:Uma2 family endonuclease